MISHLDNRNLDNQYFIVYLIDSERKLFINNNEIIIQYNSNLK